MKWLFELRGELTNKQRLVLSIIGLVLLLLLWWLVTLGENPIIDTKMLPRPADVFKSYGELYSENNLIKNTFHSIGLNVAGYLKAIFFALIIGFLIGLYPIFRGMFQSHLDAIRFLPLAAVTGLFIIWFNTGTTMKVNFLAFGILIFLLPVVVSRISDVKDVYLKTVHTLGASDWMIIKTVYFPSVISRLFDDIRILTAISWTYIVVVETITQENGIGAVIYLARRFARVDKLFALLLLIIIIGVIQDQIFKYLDKEFFPHKYQSKSKYSDKLEEPSIFEVVKDFIFSISVWIMLGIYLIMIFAEVNSGILGGVQPLSYLFDEKTLWAIHAIFIMVLLYKGNRLWHNYQSREPLKAVANG